MEIVFVVLFFFVSLIGIGHPFLRREAFGRIEPREDSFDEDLSEKRKILDETLAELDLDYSLGKISRNDYEDFRAVNRKEIKAIERRTAEAAQTEAKAIDDEIERQVREIRRRRRPGSSNEEQQNRHDLS